jgi:hypothetical protein
MKFHRDEELPYGEIPERLPELSRLLLLGLLGDAVFE